jgi:hypothetical protein
VLAIRSVDLQEPSMLVVYADTADCNRLGSNNVQLIFWLDVNV